MSAITVILVLILIGFSAACAYLFNELNKAKNSKKESKVENINEIEAIKKASDIARKKILEAEEEVAKSKKRLKDEELQLDERESKLLGRSKKIEEKLDELENQEKILEKEKLLLRTKTEEINERLQQIAQMTRAEATELLKKETEAELSDWMAKKIKESEENLRKETKEVTKNILLEAMMSSAVDFVAETTTTTVEIPDESLKSRIIGKSGRNVRSFERLTGVDVIIDESATEVTLSCFDPIRREVAALALSKLLKTGKINPATIEEMIEKTKKDILKEIKKTGDTIAFEAGVNDIPKELLMLLGRYKYRFSHGQNLIKHTLEMIKLSENLARELGANVQVTKLACLFYNIGKVIPSEGKSFQQVSSDTVSKYYKDDKISKAIEATKEDSAENIIEAEIIKIAENISRNRPGALEESYEGYIKRVRGLEDIANKHDGVKQSFAIQSGKEVRVIVVPDKVNDEDTKVLAHKIAKEIDESGLNNNSAVKVTVIREKRIEREAK